MLIIVKCEQHGTTFYVLYVIPSKESPIKISEHFSVANNKRFILVVKPFFIPFYTRARTTAKIAD